MRLRSCGHHGAGKISFCDVQLFTAVIIQNFEELESREHWAVPEENIKGYFTSWKSITQDASMDMPQFLAFMEKLPKPLGVAIDPRRPHDGTFHYARLIRMLRMTDLLVRPSTKKVYFPLHPNPSPNPHPACVHVGPGPDPSHSPD